MQGENEVAIYGNSSPVEEMLGNMLREIAEVRQMIAALRAELFGPQVPTQSDAAFPERALKWSV
jgi:hypothetical protein